MGKKILEYKMFKGSIEYSKEDNCYFGKLLNIKDLILYEGASLIELEKDFKNVVSEYIENMTIEEKEDLHLLTLMEQVDRKNTVPRNEIMEILNNDKNSSKISQN